MKEEQTLAEKCLKEGHSARDGSYRNFRYLDKAQAREVYWAQHPVISGEAICYRCGVLFEVAERVSELMQAWLGSRADLPTTARDE